jgi:hypothetical protein
MARMGKALNKLRKKEQQVLCLARTKEKHHCHSRQEITELSYGIRKELGL